MKFEHLLQYSQELVFGPNTNRDKPDTQQLHICFDFHKNEEFLK
jgi:hypothetical protein